MSYSDGEIREALEYSEIAGGEQYTESDGKLHPSDADVEVSSVAGLKDALNSSADVIAVADGTYDMTGEQVEIEDATIVGYRGWDGSDGALFHTSTSGKMGPYRYYRMFHSRTGGCRLTGFRMQGHDPYDGFTRGDYDTHLSNGIRIRGPNAEIDNMEMWGWPWCCVHLRGGSSRATADIHHNEFHSTFQLGYGYGVNFWSDSEADVHHNYFNGNRHSVNGRGNANIDYRVYDNIFGPDMNNHCVDMHCLEENNMSGRNDDPDSPNYRLRAGGMLEIWNNTFCDSSTPAIGIRGYPYEGAEVHNNRFAHSSRPDENPNTHRTSAAWYVQNMTWGSISYPPRDSEGYPENWNDYDNQFGAPDTPWESAYGAPLDIKNPPTDVGGGDSTPSLPTYGPWGDLSPDRRRALVAVLQETAMTLEELRDLLREAS